MNAPLLSARQEETFGIVSGSNNNSKPLDEIIIALQP